MDGVILVLGIVIQVIAMGAFCVVGGSMLSYAERLIRAAESIDASMKKLVASTDELNEQSKSLPPGYYAMMEDKAGVARMVPMTDDRRG